MNRNGRDLSTLGKVIRERRRLLGISQKELAVGCGFKSPSIISQIERGIRDVRVWELNRIANFLRIDLNHLFRNDLKTPPVLWEDNLGGMDKDSD